MIPLERILPEVPKFKGAFIGGAWRVAPRSSGKVRVQSPANLDWVLPSVDYSFDLIDECLDAGKKAFKIWRALPIEKRIQYLKRFGDELDKRSQKIAHLISLETGKPLDEALGEVSLLASKITVTLDEGLKRIQTQKIDLGAQGRGSIHYQPKGVMLVIGPFNFPVHLSHGHIVPALLAGNVCILKPSEKTPY